MDGPIIFTITYPDFDVLSEDEKKPLLIEKEFLNAIEPSRVLKKTKKIKRKYNELGIKEVFKESIKSLLIEELFDKMYPDFNERIEEEREVLLVIKQFMFDYYIEILKHLSSLGFSYNDMQTYRMIIITVYSKYAKKLFSRLHPDYDCKAKEEQNELIEERLFIRKNIIRILMMWRRKSEKMTIEALKDTINHLMTEDHIRLLYPDYDFVVEEERKEINHEKDFIKRYLSSINGIYSRLQSYNESDCKDTLLRESVNIMISNVYFYELYPNYYSMSKEDRNKLLIEKEYLKKNAKRLIKHGLITNVDKLKEKIKHLKEKDIRKNSEKKELIFE